MKKILFSILGVVFILAGCTKNEIPQIDQNPYRTIVEYTPGSVEMTIPGTITPDATYDWLSYTQSGNTTTFTFRRNTTGLIRRAEFTIAGQSDKAVVNQKAHSLDASLSTSITEMDTQEGYADISFSWTTAFPGDYQSVWGYIISSSTDVGAGKQYPQSSALKSEGNDFKLTGLDSQQKYYVWTYIKSTEEDVLYSNMVAILPPIHVDPSTTDLQKVVDEAPEYATIMVPGGMSFNGPVNMTGNNKNKKVLGGWDASFTEQSMDNLTVLDGRNFSLGFRCTADDSNNPMQGFCEVSYFEIKNCKGDHGSAIHACGGPITVHHCYIHDNDCEKGAIGTREEDYSTDITVYNCIISDNHADGHGAAFGFGDGASYEDQVKATVVNNLIVNNVSTKNDGYCSVAIIYNNTDIVFVNNTVVGNKNFEEYGGEYAGLNLRGNVRSLFANNIMVGNVTSANVSPADYHAMKKFLSFGDGYGTFCYNIYEGEIGSSSNATISDNKMYDSGFDITTVLANPSAGDYSPVGPALGFGTLGSVSYKEARDSGTKSCDIKALLEKYNTDLSGQPRITGGTVCAGCFEN